MTNMRLLAIKCVCVQLRKVELYVNIQQRNAATSSGSEDKETHVNIIGIYSKIYSYLFILFLYQSNFCNALQ